MKIVKESIYEEYLGTLYADYADKIWNDPYNEKTPHVEVYKNPKSIKNMKPEIRGISDSEGNLYVADDSNILHSELRQFLKISHKGTFNWTRYGRTNMFYPAESDFLAGEFTPEEMEVIERARQRNPQFQFETPDESPW